ncbi:MAG: MFS transporter [Thermoplasmatota archaeon]
MKKLFRKAFSGKGLPVSRKTLIVLSAFGAVLSGNVVHATFLKYFTDYIGMSPGAFGVIYMIFMVWNAVNDPLFGGIIDNAKPHPKKGKYVYIMKVTAPVILISMVLMLLAGPDWPSFLTYIYLIVGLFIFDTAYTSFIISFNSYVLAVAPSTDERADFSLIQNYIFMIPSFISTSIAVTFLTGGYPRYVIILLYTGFAVIGGVLFMVSKIALKDSPDLYSNYEPDNVGMKQLLKSFVPIMKNRNFLMFALYNIFAVGAASTYMNSYLYYMQYVAGASGFVAAIPDLLGGVYQLMVYPVAAYIIRKRGVRSMLRTLLWVSVMAFIGLFLAQSYYQALIGYVLLMTGFAAVYAANTPMLGVIIDEDKSRTKVYKPGVYLGIAAIFAIPARALHVAIFSFVIEYFGYDGMAAVQTERAITGIRIGAGLIPGIMVLLGIIPLFFFTIDKKKEKQLVQSEPDII